MTIVGLQRGNGAAGSRTVAGDGATKSRDGEIMVTDHYAGRKRPFCKDGTASATALRRAMAKE